MPRENLIRNRSDKQNIAHLRLMPRRSKVLSIPIAIAISVLFVGSYLKIRNQTYGYELSVIGSIGLGALYCLRFIAKDQKRLEDLVKLAMLTLWIITGVLALHQRWYFYLLLALLITGSVWVVLELRSMLFQKSFQEKVNPVLWFGALLMCMEFVCRVKSWPIVTILSLLGLSVLSVGFFIDAWKQKKKTSIN
ncbi:MAG: uncharacterized membrane protein (UPF0136 family) [Flavobacteriaceae bacterium]|jgi:uncharacterized membrane protein (UPF0136 family)